MKLVTPEEHEAARSLANWLEGDRDQDVATDILEAIYVLSPEHCPEPRVGLEKILSSVEFGPFGTKVEADGSVDDAEYLRELLSHSAPVPHTSLEMILARVEAGPFAEDAQLEAEETLEEELPDNVIRPRAWWQRTEIAVVAAAALALLILIPSNFEIPEQEMPTAALDQELSEKKSLAEEAPQVIEQTVQGAKRASKVDASASPEEMSTKKAKASELQKPSLNPKRQEAQLQTNTPVVLTEKKPKPTDELMSSTLVVRTEDRVNTGAMNKRTSNKSLSTVVNNPVILAKSDSEKEESQEDAIGPPVMDSEILDIEEIIVADADFAEEVDEIVLGSTSKRRVERKRKGFVSEISGRKSAPSPKRSMSANEAPVSEMSAETYEEGSIANIPEIFDQTAPEDFKEEASDMAGEARIQQIVELLSTTEKEAIQKLRTSAEIVNYAQNFNATKSLAVLWQGTMNRENSFAIDLLKYSVEFPSGQKKYLERNYLLLISLLVQEGRDSETQVYRQKLNALK